MNELCATILKNEIFHLKTNSTERESATAEKIKNTSQNIADFLLCKPNAAPPNEYITGPA